MSDVRWAGLERGQVLCKPGSAKPHTKFEDKAYILTKEKGRRIVGAGCISRIIA